jgi:hypothetical protein
MKAKKHAWKSCEPNPHMGHFQKRREENEILLLCAYICISKSFFKTIKESKRSMTKMYVTMMLIEKYM